METTSTDRTIRLRRSDERGFEDFGWTDNWMTFSFAQYHDPEWIRFGPIRVLVENHIQPHKGFGTHPHRDMEILTYVAAGALTHADSMGNQGAIRKGEMQRITAGTGIFHSEMNEHDEVEHNVQIWILPDRAGLTPGYEQLGFTDKERTGRLRLYASPNGRDASMRVHQDAEIYAGILPAGARVEHKLAEGRGAWIQLVRGTLETDNLTLRAGDGVGITGADRLTLKAREEAELILFDVAMTFETPYSLN
jgi:redox-sensitive bicupin YhaK (pirin superfamily)